MGKLRKVFSLIRDRRFDYIRQKLMCRFGLINSFISDPLILNIEPTNACNLACPTCVTGSGTMNRLKRMMSYDELKKIIDQAKGSVERIILWNYGEPFLNKELIPMIRYAVNNGMYVETSTNGEFFRSKEFCNEVIQSRLQKLIICLDGANQQTISKFRRGSDFEGIINGIKLMVEAKKHLKSKIPEIELQFIVMKHNVHEKLEMKQLANELGVDIYCEKTVGVDCSDPNFQSLAKELLPDDLTLSRFYKKKDGTLALRGEITNYCPRIFESAIINSDGTVVPCCYDLHSRHVMGNVFEESLDKIWRNKKYNSFRRRLMMDRKSIPMCNICPVGRHEIRKRDDLK